MNDRPLGKTGVRVSDIGYGAWGLGAHMWIGANDAESMQALHRAADLGVNVFDTALAYGDGHSESLVGRLVRERRGQEIVVATKIPPKNRVWPAPPGVPVKDTYPADHIVSSADRSLQNLGLDRIDILQLHTWRDEFLDQDGWQEAFFGLKRAGKVRFLGISVNDHDPGSAMRAVASGLVDTAQIIYNIFDQSPAEAFFPACQEHGVGVLARVPFDEGSLTGSITRKTTFPKGDWRNDYFKGDRKQQVEERVEVLRALLGPEAGTLPELALRFCLSHDAVSTVIPGMRRVSSVEANAAVGDGRKLSLALLAKLRAQTWKRNFYQ